jgi:hypothetical protein
MVFASSQMVEAGTPAATCSACFWAACRWLAAYVSADRSFVLIQRNFKAQNFSHRDQSRKKGGGMVYHGALRFLLLGNLAMYQVAIG